MTVEVTMPQMGADMTEGTVVKWLKQVGDQVTKGESIAEIETDKANVELEAFNSGVMLKILASEGTVVPVGETIAILGDAGEEVPEPARPEAARGRARITPAPAAAEARPPESATASLPTDAGESDGSAERLRISPVARRIALEHNVDVRNLQGSGPDGRILRRDVEAAMSGAEGNRPAPAPQRSETAPPREAAPGAAPSGARTEPLTRIRQTIARRMLQSKQTQPHYYLATDVDMTAAQDFRRSVNAAVGDEGRVTINDLVIKASALALARHPRFTAQFSEAGIVYPERIDINIGVAIDDGLIAPALLDCGSKSLGRIAAEARELIARTRENRLQADDYVSGCFTITNLGNYGIGTLIGVINPPQAAILGVGSASRRPAVVDGAIVARDVMTVALSADHRVTNGAEGALFLKEIQRLLENPLGLVL